MADEFAYKVIIVGDSGVGKSSLALRYCDDLFFGDNPATLGMDFKYTRCEIPEPSSSSGSGAAVGSSSRSVRLQLWDSAGHDRFIAMTHSFYRNSNGILMCFDLTNRHSFERLDLWYNSLHRFEGDVALQPPMVVVGCKLDLVARHASASEVVGALLQPTATTNRGAGASSSLGGGGGNMILPVDAQPIRLRQVEAQEAVDWAMKHHALCYLETSAKDSINIDAVFQQLAMEMVGRAADAAMTVGGSAGDPSSSAAPRQGPLGVRINRPSKEPSSTSKEDRYRCC